MSFTKIINEQSSYNFGIQVLDQILDKITPGTLILIEEDPHSYSSKLITKCFCAQTIKNNTDIIIISPDNQPLSLPSFAETTPKQTDQKMQIAWQYQKYSQNMTSNKFDFTKKMEENVQKIYDASLENLFDILKKNKNKTIVIFSFLSPLWFHQNNLKTDELDWLLLKIKYFVKKNRIVLLVTSPVYLYDKNLDLYFDIVMKLETQVVFYDGILEIKKCRSIGVIDCYNCDVTKFGYFIYKTGVHMERIQMPPED